MADYSHTTPVTDLGVDAKGTRTAEVSELGRGQYMARDAGERLPAFAGLAKRTGGFLAENEGGMTLKEGMRAARMNYTVEFQDRLQVTEITEDGVTETLYPGRGTRAFWEGNPQPVGLGVVGDRYQLVQPREAGELGQQLMRSSGATMVAAGIYGKPVGAQTYMAFKLPEGLTIGGEDRHDLYLTILNSYNGKTGLTGLFAPIRLVCTNQTTATFGKGVANRFSFRHSGDMENKISAALEALGVAEEWTEIWSREAERLLATELTGKDLDAYLGKVLDIRDDSKAATSLQTRLQRRVVMKKIITESDTCAFGRGTAYAALQGVQEWADWYTTTKQNGEFGDIARFTRTLNGGEPERLKLRAASLLGV